MKIALVGRPNVGKSTLFNKLTGRKAALVDDEPGVTRDRRYGQAKLGKLRFTVIDTAGLDQGAAASLQGRMREQTNAAIAESDAVFFIVDARQGLTPPDREFAQLVRRTGKTVMVLANKCEGQQTAPAELFALGLGEPMAISAEHGIGLKEVERALAPVMAEREQEEGLETQPAPLTLAVLGRPNAGKSTLVNRWLGENRLLTGPEAGITRDAIAIDTEWRGKKMRIVDTAGLRKRARIEDRLEKLSAGDAIHAMKFAHIVALVIDASRGLDKQDLTLARLAAEEGRGLVILANKSDQLENPQKQLAAIKERLDHSLSEIPDVPFLPISATTGRNCARALDMIFTIHDVWNRRIPTPRLNRWLAEAIARHPAPLVNGRRLKPRYIAQSASRPPSFTIMMNRAEKLPDAYKRYLLNGLREAFDLKGIVLRLFVKGSKNPYQE
ncbi:MAG TPA: ribosome biogenesis GTPase Der [Dongiaceae bacterium]|jgi:GTP-binding protein|nr:ribosome biogenesis GTPase Der [Dongiaceae bacterium]